MAVDLPPLKRIIQDYDQYFIASLLGVGQRHRFRRHTQVHLKFDGVISLGGISEYNFKNHVSPLTCSGKKRGPSVAIAPFSPANLRLAVMR